MLDPEESPVWEQVAPRKIPARDWKKYERYMTEIFGAFEGT